MIARVLVDLNLPQVDRLFDFRVPGTLAPNAKAGVRVRVPYGKAGKPVDGFIVELAETSDFEGELREILEVVSPAPVLKPDVYQLVRSVADRQVATAAEVIKNAIPPRSVKVEKIWLDDNIQSAELNLETLEAASKQIRQVVEPWPNDKLRAAIVSQTGVVKLSTSSRRSHPIWALCLFLQAIEQRLIGKSTILCLADFRDSAVIFEIARELGIDGFLVDYSVSLQPSKRYSAFLRALGDSATIVVGNRSAIYAPVNNLSLISLWDDDDDSLEDQASPYCAAREIALIRQSQSGCQLVFAANSRSVHTQRLVEIGYLDNFIAPRNVRVACSEATSRISPAVFAAIKAALRFGPVLVQVSALGTSTSLYCAQCSTRAQCHICNGPLWANSVGHNQCRWCSALNDAFRCVRCQGTKLRPGKAGSKRTLEQFGAMLPGVALREFNGSETEELYIDDKPRLVVSTPGAEPQGDSGFAAVVILDANDMLARDSIDATADAVRHWMNAASKVKADGSVLIAGLEGQLARLLENHDLEAIARLELANRRELNFPPAVRLATVEAEQKLLDRFLASLDRTLIIDTLGPSSITTGHGRGSSQENLNRLILRFKYSEGALLATHLRELSLKLSVGQTRVSQNSGRNARPIKIKMDDRSVL